jgi:hypothetical protein
MIDDQCWVLSLQFAKPWFLHATEQYPSMWRAKWNSSIPTCRSACSETLIYSQKDCGNWRLSKLNHGIEINRGPLFTDSLLEAGSLTGRADTLQKIWHENPRFFKQLWGSEPELTLSGWLTEKMQFDWSQGIYSTRFRRLKMTGGTTHECILQSRPPLRRRSEISQRRINFRYAHQLHIMPATTLAGTACISK